MNAIKAIAHALEQAEQKGRAEATLAEREACAKVAESVAWVIHPENDYGEGVKAGAAGQLEACAAAIRARKP